MTQVVHDYIEISTELGRRREPVIKGKGYPVWSVIGYLFAVKGDVKQVMEDYKDRLTSDEINAALRYYLEHKEEIDAKLKANLTAAD